MSYMVMLVVDDADQCPAVLDAWEKAGAPGVTVLTSTGLGRIRKAGLREDAPLLPSLHELLENEEVQHRTLFAVVETKDTADALVKAANQLLGDLDQPHSGFMFVVPVAEVYGFGKHRTDRSKE